MSSRPLDAAIAMSRLSKCRHKHGAVLIKSGQVLAAATNLIVGDTTDTTWRTAQLHAEEIVLRIAGTRAKGATLYVARTNLKGETRLSLPCQRCASKIERAKIRRVVTT